MTVNTQNSSDLLHVLHTSVLEKYLKHHKASFREKKCLDTFPAHRNIIMVLTVITENSSFEQQ